MGFGNMQQMMKQVQKMQRDMARVQEELKDRVVEATAGGGAVRVEITCAFDVRRVEIRPDAIDPSDPEFLAELVRQAVQSAINAAQETTQGEMTKVTGGLRLPGM